MRSRSEIGVVVRRFLVAGRLLGDARTEDDAFAELQTGVGLGVEQRPGHGAPFAGGAARQKVMDGTDTRLAGAAVLLRAEWRGQIGGVVERGGKERHRPRDSLAVLQEQR